MVPLWLAYALDCRTYVSFVAYEVQRQSECLVMIDILSQGKRQNPGGGGVSSSDVYRKAVA